MTALTFLQVSDACREYLAHVPALTFDIPPDERRKMGVLGLVKMLTDLDMETRKQTDRLIREQILDAKARLSVPSDILFLMRQRARAADYYLRLLADSTPAKEALLFAAEERVPALEWALTGLWQILAPLWIPVAAVELADDESP